MGYDINISGFIEGISEESFDLIKEDLEDVFNEVYWKDNTIEIYSHGNHHDELMQHVYNKIAFCMNGGGSGQLDIEGEECGDFSTIFFAPRQWKQVWLEITRPANPFLNKGLNITYSRTAHVHVNPSMLDAIKNEFDGWVNSHERICVESDDLKNRLTSSIIENMKVFQYLNNVKDVLIEEVRDIVFHT